MYRKLSPLLLVIVALFCLAITAPSSASTSDHDDPVCGASFTDMDGDGILDAVDNCIEVPNSHMVTAAFDFCPSQFDVDGDGYGNACDADVNQNGGVGLDDFSAIWLELGSTDPVYDINCNGAVDLDDVYRAFGSDPRYESTPGPSGHACAGSTPCP